MIKKLKCPYCDIVMVLDYDSVHAWMRCNVCLSTSPKVYKPEWVPHRSDKWNYKNFEKKAVKAGLEGYKTNRPYEQWAGDAREVQDG